MNQSMLFLQKLYTTLRASGIELEPFTLESTPESIALSDVSDAFFEVLHNVNLKFDLTSCLQQTISRIEGLLTVHNVNDEAEPSLTHWVLEPSVAEVAPINISDSPLKCAESYKLKQPTECSYKINNLFPAGYIVDEAGEISALDLLDLKEFVIPDVSPQLAEVEDPLSAFLTDLLGVDELAPERVRLFITTHADSNGNTSRHLLSLCVPEEKTQPIYEYVSGVI